MAEILTKSCYVKVYKVASKSLETVDSQYLPETEIGYLVSYEDKDKFKNDYMNGEIKFTSLPTVSDDTLMNLIQEDIKNTGVEVLLQSSILTGANPEDTQAPAPIEKVIAKKINKSTAIRMKSPSGDIDWFAPSEFNKAVENGWVPTRREFIQYPIMCSDDKVEFTINVAEIKDYVAQGKTILIFNIDKLVDAELFKSTYSSWLNNSKGDETVEVKDSTALPNLSGNSEQPNV